MTRISNLAMLIPKRFFSASISSCIILLTSLELGLGIMQLIGLIPSSHPSHIITGTFYNSGPYACFLAIGFPIIIRRTITADNKLQKFSCMMMVVLSSIIIPATLSRIACVACCIGGAVAIYPMVFSDTAHTKRIRLTVLVLLMALVLAAGAYFIKKNSADGRFLMWKVSAQAVMEVPALGVGWANVAGAYGEAQERYFASGHGSEAEIMIADAPEYVFNEYLQVAIAFGPLSALVMTAVTAGGVIIAIRNKALGIAGAAVAVMVVMAASYPLQFPLFVMAISLIMAGCYLSSGNRLVNVIGATVIGCSCIIFLTHNQTVDVRSGFAVGHSLHKMKEYRKSNDRLLALLPHSSDPMILNIIGKNYQSLGIPDSAEYYIMRSVNRCPNRLYPHYLLMNLYSDSVSRDRDKMFREAKILVTKKEKIPSPAIEEMREKARKTLKSNIE